MDESRRTLPTGTGTASSKVGWRGDNGLGCVQVHAGVIRVSGVHILLAIQRLYYSKSLFSLIGSEAVLVSTNLLDMQGTTCLDPNKETKALIKMPSALLMGIVLYRLMERVIKLFLSLLSGESAESPDVVQAMSGVSDAPPAVIPSQGDLLGDLLNLDLAPPTTTVPAVPSSMQMGAMDLLGGGLDSLVGPQCSFHLVYTLLMMLCSGVKTLSWGFKVVVTSGSCRWRCTRMMGL